MSSANPRNDDSRDRPSGRCVEVAFWKFRKRDLYDTEAKEVAVTCAHSGKERVAEVLGHVGHAEETDGGH